MRTFLLCLFAVALCAAETAPLSYQEVSIENGIVRVVLENNRGNLKRLEMLADRPISLPKHLAATIHPLGDGPLGVLRAFQPSGAHNWVVDHDAEVGGLTPADQAPWLINKTSDREVSFTYEKPGRWRWQLFYELHATRPTVETRLVITNLGQAEAAIAPMLVPLNGVHQDWASADQPYCSAFYHLGGIDGNIKSESLPLDRGVIPLTASDKGVDFLGLKSRFFAAWWTPGPVPAATAAAAPVVAPAAPANAGGPAGPGAPVPVSTSAAVLPNAGAWAAQVVGFHGNSGEQQSYILVSFGKAAVKPGESWNRGWSLSASSMAKAELARLSEIERRVEYTDGFYRFFRILAQGLIWILSGIHWGVANWGICVILLTILVKAVLYRTTFKQQESMLKMQRIGPELKYIQEQYKNNKQMLAQKQMELFKKHGVNPLGGCLPLLIQMPIFIALFQAFSHCADLRGQSFLWIHDLTQSDQVWGMMVSWFPGGVISLNPLPIIYIGVSIWMSLNQKPPANADPQQESMYKMMRWLPVIFGVIFYQMPSGLVLYFTVQAVIGVLEMKYIKRKLGMA